MKTLCALWVLLAFAAAPDAQSAQQPAPVPPKPQVKQLKKPVVIPAQRTAVPRKRAAPRPRAVAPNPQLVAQAREQVNAKVEAGISANALENHAALVPFFEQLYQHQQGNLSGPLHILHYGDSHTAADEWTGELRTRFQQMFGDGGSGYSLAGRPWNSYRRGDLKSGSTSKWYTDGLLGRTGDGMYGLGGISMSTAAAHESVYLIADGENFELFYLQQPGGGGLDIYDNGNLLERISTEGNTEPRYFRYQAEPGTHRLEAETVDAAPVRVFGWTAEKSSGVTYENFGINGAEASIMLSWNEEVLRANIAHRNPALVILAYGTNEAGHANWNIENYREMFAHLVARMRDNAPTATILVAGPLDRGMRLRQRGWVTLDGVDKIIEAQKQVCAALGCVFWDQRASMGGKGSIHQWVQAGMAQADRVHLTGPGYHTMGDALFRDVMEQYDRFVKAREALATSGTSGRTSPGTALAAPR